MNINFHKSFQKSYRKLDSKIQKKVDIAIHKFRTNPSDKTLRNHPLTGNLQGKRVFSVTGNVRVVFEEYDNYVLVVMLDVGNHPQVYGT